MSEQLGLRGILTYYESLLRLIGGANATGAIAAGAALHAFADNADLQSSVKLAGVLFLFGVFTFAIALMVLFVATFEIDHALHKPDEPTWPTYLFWVPQKSVDEYRKEAQRMLVIGSFVGLASFALFMSGLASVLIMAVRLQLN